jgi:hypothetical protein
MVRSGDGAAHSTRKKPHFVPTEQDLYTIAYLLSIGSTKKSICERFNITTPTLNKFIDNHKLNDLKQNLIHAMETNLLSHRLNV